MKRFLIFIIIIVCVMPGSDVWGRTYYNSARNNFGGLFPHPGMRMQGRYKAIEDDRLVEENASIANAITIDTTTIHSTAYRYQLRLACLNNKQGKTLTVRNPTLGGKTTITTPQWGMVFDFDTDGNYRAVVLSCDNSAPYDDLTDSRSMQVSLIENRNGQATTLASTDVSKNVSLEDALNTVSIDVDEQGVTVSVGKDEPVHVLEAPLSRPAGTVQVGYLVGPGARVAVERAVLTIDHEQQAVVPQSSWTPETLQQHFASSTDPLEGYWKYLDRDMHDDWLMLGGYYTLALVRSQQGYDIIYIDGAQVNQALWHTGMIKGSLTKTMFSGNYDLSWMDSTQERIGQESYAAFQDGVILVCTFPEYNSQVRFSKVITLDD